MAAKDDLQRHKPRPHRDKKVVRERQLAAVRSRIVNACLIGLSLIGLPALAASLHRYFDIGFLPIMAVQGAIMVVIFGVTFLRNRLNYSLRAGTIVGVYFALGLGAQISLLHPASGLVFHFGAGVLAFLLLGNMAGSVMIGLSLAAVFAVYSLLASGILQPQIDLSIYALTFSAWLTSACSLAIVALPAGASIAVSQRYLVNSISRARGARERLRMTAASYRAARDQATKASNAKSEFLATASHELRTPLNAILGFSEVLMTLGEKVPAERKAEYIKDIHASGQLLLALVNDLLDLARIEAGRHPLDESEFDLSGILDEAVATVAPTAQAAEVTVSIEKPVPALTVTADRRSLLQVLLNLLSNAIKYNQSGGSVSCRVTRLRNGDAEIAVEDTGIGIDPTLIPELFEPFHQANSQVTRDAGGSGLGLAIVKRLVLLHGGEVRMTSAPGRGSVVRVRLPADRVRLVSPVRLARAS